jgi:hypothetical protein
MDMIVAELKELSKINIPNVLAFLMIIYHFIKIFGKFYHRWI